MTAGLATALAVQLRPDGDLRVLGGAAGSLNVRRSGGGARADVLER